LTADSVDGFSFYTRADHGEYGEVVARIDDCEVRAMEMNEFDSCVWSWEAEMDFDTGLSENVHLS